MKSRNAFRISKPHDRRAGMMRKGRTNDGTKRPAASNGVHLDAAKHSVKSWLDKATVLGGEMRGGEAHA
jgi:hypothetical protein